MKQLIEDLNRMENCLRQLGYQEEAFMRTTIRKAIEELSKHPDPEFIEYVKNARAEFVKALTDPDTKLREFESKAESLLIAYDQMAAQLKPTGRTYSEDEVRRAVELTKDGTNYRDGGNDYSDNDILAILDAEQDNKLKTEI